MELCAPCGARELISLGTRLEIIGYLWMAIDIRTSDANGASFFRDAISPSEMLQFAENIKLRQ